MGEEPRIGNEGFNLENSPEIRQRVQGNDHHSAGGARAQNGARESTGRHSNTHL